MAKDVMSTRFRYIVYALPVFSLGVLLLLFNTTNPVDVGPLGIFTVFVVTYLFWLGVFFTFSHGGLSLLRKVGGLKVQLGVQRAYYIASVVAFVPVLILGMQSVGQLELQDIVLVLLFCGLAIFYIVRRTA